MLSPLVVVERIKPNVMEIGSVVGCGMRTSGMRTEAIVEEGIKPCCYQKQKIKIDLKSQQPWTAVSALLGLISMAQLPSTLPFFISFSIYSKLMRTSK